MTQSHEDATTVTFVAFYDVLGSPGRPHDLAEVLGEASWFRMDLSRDELEHGVRDLVASGLLAISHGSPVVTEHGLTVWKSLDPERNRGVDERAPYWRPIEIARAHLPRLECVAERGGWTISDEDFRAARGELGRRLA